MRLSAMVGLVIEDMRQRRGERPRRMAPGTDEGDHSPSRRIAPALPAEKPAPSRLHRFSMINGRT